MSSSSVQSYRILLYQRALHPELFDIQERRNIVHGEYEVESWLVPGGHVIRFESGGQCITEAVSEQDLQLPQRGLMHTIPCLGEKEIEEAVNGTVRYVSSVQTELLSDNLFTATFNEMQEFARDSNAMQFIHETEDGRQNLSLLDVQRYKREIHAQAYHLVSQSSFVLRTQSIFEIAGA
jgi:hypothetical protein